MLLVSNIQRFSLHDGPGIRTTVFCMGCSLRCPWCANPENLIYKRRIRYFEDKCVAVGKCCNYSDECGAKNKFNISLEKIEKGLCPVSALKIVGKEFNTEDLVEEILKDQEYLKFGGGVTFSGGEALLQIDDLLPVLQQLKEKKINICFETCLFVPKQNVDKALKYVDEWIVDIKIIDYQKCKNILNGDLDRYLENLEGLFSNSTSIVMRLPLVDKITNTLLNLERIVFVLKKYRPTKLEIFSVHNLAESKYKTLGEEFFYFPEIEEEELEKVKDFFCKEGIRTEICKI